MLNLKKENIVTPLQIKLLGFWSRSIFGWRRGLTHSASSIMASMYAVSVACELERKVLWSKAASINLSGTFISVFEEYHKDENETQFVSAHVSENGKYRKVNMIQVTVETVLPGRFTLKVPFHFSHAKVGKKKKTSTYRPSKFSSIKGKQTIYFFWPYKPYHMALEPVYRENFKTHLWYFGSLALKPVYSTESILKPVNHFG